jgi:spore germination cell wall hydrolase CwlJ-like protein
MTELDWPGRIDASARSRGDTDCVATVAAGVSAGQPAGDHEVAFRRQRRGFRLTAGRAALVMGSCGGAVLLYGSLPRAGGSGQVSVTQPLPQATIAAPVINLPPPDLLRPISPQEAAKENADRPFADRPDTAASRFVLKTDAADRDRALNCLAQAVYYEAASEGVDGGRAVAQVVLNRMKHPGYPASVCGVVYQGSDRTSGCQFTFTCDGSLLRTPIASLWARSRKIAEEALTGRVFAPVGHATHYHADYVLPYWADSLDKSVQIGRHIFYRLRNSIGDSRAFFQRYAGAEPQLPAPNAAVVIPAEAVTEQLASALISDSVAKAAQDVEKVAAVPSSPLLVDSSHGNLLADSGLAPTQAHRPKRSTDCAGANDRKQLAPLGANDVRTGSTASTC